MHAWSRGHSQQVYEKSVSRTRLPVIWKGPRLRVKLKKLSLQAKPVTV
jgi:hypothetical protein